MKCADISERMVDFLYGELAEGERRAWEAHVASCDSCRREVAAYERTLGRARTAIRGPLAEEPPARVRVEVLKAAAAALAGGALPAGGRTLTSSAEPDGAKGGLWAWLRRPWFLPAFAAVAAAAILIVAQKPILDSAESIKSKAPAPGTSEAVNVENEAPTPFPASSQEASRSRAAAAAPAPAAAEPPTLETKPPRAEAYARDKDLARVRKKPASSAAHGKGAVAAAAPAKPRPAVLVDSPADEASSRFAVPPPPKNKRDLGERAVGKVSSGGGVASQGQDPARASAGYGVAGGRAGDGLAGKKEAPAEKQAVERRVANRGVLDRETDAVPFPASPPPAAAPAPEPAPAPPSPVMASAPQRLQQPSPAPAGAAGPAVRRPAAPAPVATRAKTPPPPPAPRQTERAESKSAAAEPEGAEEGRARDDSREGEKSQSAIDALARRAERLFAEQRWAEAVAAYRDLLRRAPGHPSAKLWKSRIESSVIAAARESAPPSATRAPPPAAKAERAKARSTSDK
jgi:hypothetical protein